MRIAAISDTHGRHHFMPPMPDADVLVVAGDILGQGMNFEIRDFVKWCLEQPVEDVVFIAGNHDWAFEKEDAARAIIAETIEAYAEEHKHVPRVHYLCDSGVEIGGRKFWGSPWTPVYFDWAFMKEDELLAEFWLQIPEGVDVLVTHGPPKDILDKVLRRRGYGLNVGSATLRTRVEQVKPRAHIFGHIHEHGGVQEKVGDTLFCNVAAHDERYSRRASPWCVVEI